MGKIFANFDWLITIPVIILGGFSLAILSASGKELFLSQLVFFILGLFIFLIFSQIDFSVFKSLSFFLYFFSLFLLFLTFFGPHVRGATRWVEILGVRWQPSEMVKTLAVLSFASFFSSSPPRSLKSLVIGLIIIAVPLVLIFRQPDLGNAIIILGIWSGIIYAAGLPVFLGIGGGVFFVLFLPLIWFFLKDYQRARILSFLNPYLDPAGAGYHSIQAIIAVGSGTLMGRGLGEGSQSRLLFLPEYHTDFIFAALVEDLGLLGAFFVVLSYIVLLWHILQIAKNSKNPFASLVLVGVFCLLFLQVFINIGMNLGLVPITGITLPLLSYGGSSFLSVMILLGIVANISKETNKNQAIDIIP